MVKLIERFFYIFVLLLFSISFVNATVNVVDVRVEEFVYEQVLYNPLQTGGGVWFDGLENQTIYLLNGTITVFNNHPTEPIQDIVLNFTNISSIYNVTNSGGSNGVITDFNLGSNFMTILIPDLGPGANSTFSYFINTTNIRPALNFTTNYSDTSIFAGLDLSVTDTVQNVLNSTLYPDFCVYNISIIQDTASVSQGGGVLLNFTYDNNSLTGTDASNVSFNAANTTLTWAVRNGGCLNATQQTDISYLVQTPAVADSQDYQFINSTISYNLNSTISLLELVSTTAVGDLSLNFEKYQENTLTGDNATWRISSEIVSFSNITVNLTSVTLWVSQRNGTGTGFTNPSLIDTDTVSGANLTTTYNPNVLLNLTQNPWNNTGTEWRFNYTFSSSPIVWMDLKNTVLNDGTQLSDRSVTYGNNSVYIKEIYLVTGYWLEISRNITRLNEGNFSIFIQVSNLGSAPTPGGQAVVVYNFLPNTFNLTSSFVYSSSTWYNTSETNETLNDAEYNGTMYQYALIPNGNPTNSSLDKFGNGLDANNTWSVEYNVSGSGDYSFDDLFLTGVDPLNVKEYGATKSMNIQSVYKVLSGKTEVLMATVAGILGVLVILL